MGGDLVEAHQLFGYSMVLLGGTSNSVSVKTPRMVRECKKKDLESRYLSFGIHPESRAQETEDWRTQVHAVGLGCGSLETFADWKGGRYLIPQRQNLEFCLLSPPPINRPADPQSLFQFQISEQVFVPRGEVPRR